MDNILTRNWDLKKKKLGIKLIYSIACLDTTQSNGPSWNLA